MEKRKLEEIEEYILGIFHARRVNRVLTKGIFESTDKYANADIVRGLEDLEKKWRMLVRYTDEGNDWVELTPEGAAQLGKTDLETIVEPKARPHPPKSST